MMLHTLAQSTSPDEAAKAVEAARRALKAAEEALERVDGAPPYAMTMTSILSNYLVVFVVAFLVCLVTVPIMRKMAIRYGIVDWPNERKVHRQPIAYLGGIAVYLGLMAGVLIAYLPNFPYHSPYVDAPPTAILLGITLILLTGVVDDVWGLSPRIKVGGQLLAAAALAVEDVGVKVAGGLMRPLGEFFGNPDLTYVIPMPTDLPIVGTGMEIDLIYWFGTGIIAICVLGACNASNLIDGLDGLLAGTTSITAAGLLIISLFLAETMLGSPTDRPGGLDAARIVLSLALLGACLGFLPYNFNPANIFLGDAGSLLLGFTTISIILMLGERGFTHLVLAGLIVYAVPCIDTALAIVRRKMAGRPIMSPDDQHLHHMLKRSGLGVKGAVFVLYGIATAFCILGVALVFFRGRVAYACTLVLASFVGVTAIKIARRHLVEQEMAALVTDGPEDAPPSKRAGVADAEQAADESTFVRVDDPSAG
jgi:UDP-GlcNAc:undecaprenyl-phosphate GlcNAc-1-phosphate transferase